VLVARNRVALDRIASDLSSAGGRATVCTIDVAEDGAAERIAAVAEGAFGGFDTWVNCAAVSDYGTLEQIGLAEHRRVFEVDYFAMLAGCLVALKHLRARGGGAIINVGSILSDRAVIEQGPYSGQARGPRAHRNPAHGHRARRSPDLRHPDQGRRNSHALRRARPQPHGRAAANSRR
jgi:short-subunit dehydrogenase